MTGWSSMKTSIFSGALAGAFDWVRLVVVNNNPALFGDWASRQARVNGARNIFRLKNKNLLLSEDQTESQFGV